MLYMSETLTILSLISSQGYYGAENMLVTLARSLSTLGCNSIVGVFSDHRDPHTEVAEQARRQGLAVETVPCVGRWDRNAVEQIRKLLAKYGVDVLHPHGYKADIYAYAAARPRRVALVATVHNWPSRLLKMRAYAALDKLLLRNFDQVVAVSDVPSDILRRWGLSRNKVSTISNGVDVERFHGAVPTLQNEIAPNDYSLVGFVGRLVPEKGGELLLQAAKQVLAVRPKTIFVFVGEGSSRTEWEALANRLGISKQVVFTGARTDLPGVYASLDMLVLPSLVESLPMCLLEAMAAGKPVVATSVGGIPRLVTTEETGLLVEPNDVSGLVAAIVRLLENRELAERLGQNGHVRCAQNFSAESMARSYIRQYEIVARACRENRKHSVMNVVQGE
jgi:glycosyltransferase involved in cell wall biosynthesis